jgi:hypothetical protein
MSLNLDVISDVICPWCYIGKRRLEQALAALETRQEIRVHWHPFQLNPAMPKEGISRQEYRTRKFGSWERSQELDAKLSAAGKSDGIDFVSPIPAVRFGSISRIQTPFSPMQGITVLWRRRQPLFQLFTRVVVFCGKVADHLFRCLLMA